MTKFINSLVEERSKLNAEHVKAIEDLQNLLQSELDAVFNKDVRLTKAVSDLEVSTDYSGDEYGEIYRYILWDVPSEYLEYSDELANWFSEHHGVSLEPQSKKSYGILKLFEGECIVVNHEGDVFLGHRLIIDSDACKDSDGEYSSERCIELIRAYMDREGYFPTVLRQTYHGDLYLVKGV